MSESRFQRELIKRLDREFPGCIIIKNPPDRIQGIPDLLILFGDRWAALEVKASQRAPERPNQRWYVVELDRMSFAAFIFPENEDRVIHELQLAFGTRR